MLQNNNTDWSDGQLLMIELKSYCRIELISMAAAKSDDNDKDDENVGHMVMAITRKKVWQGSGEEAEHEIGRDILWESTKPNLEDLKCVCLEMAYIIINY